MTSTNVPVAQWRVAEMHRFRASGEPFVYLVPSAAVFRLDEVSDAVLDVLESSPHASTDAAAPEELTRRLSHRFTPVELAASLEELARVQAVKPSAAPVPEMVVDTPPADFPLNTLVLNVTSKCNLACTYCYEYGEDNVVDTAMPSLMDEATAHQSVDLLFERSGAQPVVHLTFFGGETLLNLKVLQKTVEYARRRAVEVGKQVEFGLTTNATLLEPAVIDWLTDNDVGVTVSIDGPREVQDRFRVFHDGAGSYENIEPKVRELLRRHRRRAIGARVTLTQQNLDVLETFRHLTRDIGFREVGFAPVTTSSCRDYAIDEAGYERMLAQFEELGREFVQAAAERRHHGFSNAKETIEEIHKGVSKAYPCGAGLGLLGVSTAGDVGLCHRFAGSAEHVVGTVAGGIDPGAQTRFLEEHHIAYKPDCHSCWARPLCAGGCYHEAQTRYGSTAAPNLHYCDWIRRWTHTCLELYGELSVRAPEYFHRPSPAEVSLRVADHEAGNREASDCEAGNREAETAHQRANHQGETT